MRRASGLRILCLFLLLPFCHCAQASSAENSAPKYTHLTALRALSINRSLLTKYEMEYQTLLNQAQTSESEQDQKKLVDLQYKIQALKDDALRLQSTLPKPEAAKEFLEDLVQRQKAYGRTQPLVNPQSEKIMSEKINGIFERHEKALALVAQNRYREAEVLYEEIILESPDDDEAYLLLGHTSLAARDYEKAGEAFGNAIHINPANRREIIRLYDNVLVENPSDDIALTQRGYAYLLLGSVKDAQLSFEDALRVNPNNPEAVQALEELRQELSPG